MAGFSEEHIDINYASSKTDQIRLVDLVSSLLFDERKDVVLFGEGNFTFSIALAAARNTERLKEAVAKGEEALIDVWDGITVTYYASGVLFNFAVAKNKNLKEIKNLGESGFFHLNYKIISAVVPPNPSHTIRYGVDATTAVIDPSLTSKDVVWFQCPWTNPWEDIPKLITDFMTNLSKQQKIGQYLLIGITNFFPYVTNYYLQDLGIFTNSSIIHGYQFLGGDTAAIGKLLHLGYRHEGIKDIYS